MTGSPYDAPTSASPSAKAPDVHAARPGFAVGLLGFVIVVAGLFAATVWPQLVVFGVRVLTVMKVVPPLITVIGLAVIPLGAFVASGRFWASLLVTPALAFLTIIEIVWTLWAFANGALTLLYPFAVVAAGAALLCAVISLALTKRIRDARRALLYGP